MASGGGGGGLRQGPAPGAWALACNGRDLLKNGKNSRSGKNGKNRMCSAGTYITLWCVEAKAF